MAREMISKYMWWFYTKFTRDMPDEAREAVRKSLENGLENLPKLKYSAPERYIMYVGDMKVSMARSSKIKTSDEWWDNAMNVYISDYYSFMSWCKVPLWQRSIEYYRSYADVVTSGN